MNTHHITVHAVDKTVPLRLWSKEIKDIVSEAYNSPSDNVHLVVIDHKENKLEFTIDTCLLFNDSFYDKMVTRQKTRFSRIDMLVTTPHGSQIIHSTRFNIS